MENFIVITSVINPPNTPLSYIHYRSMFSKQERYEQTLKTIHEAKKYINNSYICFVECSPDIKEYEENIIKLVDKYVNIYNNPKLREIINCPYKGYGESIQILEGISLIPVNIQFKNFFKLSGRYYLTDNFKLNLFNNDNIVVNIIDSLDNINTVLYKLPFNIVKDYENFLKHNSPEYFLKGLGAEKVFPIFLKKYTNMIKYNFNFALEGHVSVSGELWKGSHYPSKNIYIANNSMHKMNSHSLHLCIKMLNWNLVDNIEQADVIYSASEPLEIKYPNKKYIFGPHFSIIPDQKSYGLSNKYNNVIYIQPSDWARDVWKNDYNFNNVPIVTYNFCIDVEKYTLNNEMKSEVFVYVKRRDYSDVSYVLNILNEKNVKFILLEYGKYNEEDYINILKKSKYGIWIGSQESQGFALECALSMGVPLLVWNVSKMSQEFWCPSYYFDIKTPVTSIPYWDNRCGEFFYDKDQFIETYNKFINQLYTYKPRDFVLDNLSPAHRSLALIELVNKI